MILLLAFALKLSGQADSLMTRRNIDFLYQRLFDDMEGMIESLADESTDDVMEAVQWAEECEALLSEYERLMQQPININSDETRRLEELGLLTPFQVTAIKEYRKRFGELMYLEELKMMEDFNERTLMILAPIVNFGKSEWQQEQEKITMSKAISRGKHQLTLNYAQKFEAKEGYDEATDSMMMARPNAYYLGSPMKWQLKYTYRFNNKFRLGFAMENDAGEPFLFRHLSDTIRSLVRQNRRPGFDFYGFHLYLSDISMGKLAIEALALGDYQVSFGQGLTMWSGFSIGGASGSGMMIKRASGVRPKASAGEGRFLRGGATTLRLHDFHATVFYSHKRIDGLSESGYHRTLGELSKRHRNRQQVLGGHLSYSTPPFELGYTLVHTWFDTLMALKPSKYNQFYYQGNRLTNMGMDFRWQLSKAVLFGECSMSDSKALAGLVGLTCKPAGYINFTLMYRNYGMRYQNLFFGAIKASSRGQGEEGFHLGLQCAPAADWEFIAHSDFYRLKWLSSQAYNPSWGQEHLLKVARHIGKRVNMEFQLKSKTRMKNSVDDHVFSHYPIFYTRRTLRFQITYNITESLIFSDKVFYSHYVNDDSKDSKGYLFCHDIAYRPVDKDYAFTFRYALFSSDDYNSRISLYENDVLGAFSIPSFSGLGSRIFLLGKVKLFGCLSVYSRLGFTLYSEETKVDWKAEAIWKIRSG